MFFNKNFLKKGQSRISGRNNQGRITIRHRGGGFKRKVFFIDFFRSFKNQTFLVCGYFYRSAKFSSLAILKNTNGFFCVILNAKGLSIGDFVKNYFKIDFINFRIGSSYSIGIFPIGSHIHNVELQPFSGGKIARSTGCFGIILQKNTYVLVKLPSGQTLYCSPNNRASFGEVNSFKMLYKIYKAGQSRWLGRRPTVRGVAINAVDHPHGGGEGKGRLGRVPVSPWGSILKGKKK